MKNKFFTFIGPIAAGKGTQAQILCEKYGMYHLSTGQIFRDAISSETELDIASFIFFWFIAKISLSINPTCIPDFPE